MCHEHWDGARESESAIRRSIMACRKTILSRTVHAVCMPIASQSAQTLVLVVAHVQRVSSQFSRWSSSQPCKTFQNRKSELIAQIPTRGTRMAWKARSIITISAKPVTQITTLQRASCFLIFFNAPCGDFGPGAPQAVVFGRFSKRIWQSPTSIDQNEHFVLDNLV